MYFCINCGTKLEDNMKFCYICGRPVDNCSTDILQPPVPTPEPVKHRVCSKCGASLSDNQMFCLKCGSYNQPPLPPRPEDELSEPIPECKWRFECASLRNDKQYKRAYYWLQKKNLLDKAERFYDIKVRIEDKKRTVKLKSVSGAASRSDVEDLIQRQFLYELIMGPVHRIANWPTDEYGNECFACEIGDRVLIVENARQKRLEDMRKSGFDGCLYGCPYAASIERSTLTKTTEIIPYE